jgi:hypothetical protein
MINFFFGAKFHIIAKKRKKLSQILWFFEKKNPKIEKKSEKDCEISKHNSSK